MAWIEFHPSDIKRLPKFRALRNAMSWSVNETLGCLGNLWGELIDVQEDGDLTAWKPAAGTRRADLAELLNIEKTSTVIRLWEALVENRWIDQTADGKYLVHDWLNYSGRWLRGKYSGKNKDTERLVAIWALHGRVYGEKDSLASVKNDVAKMSHPTQPNHTIPTAVVPDGTTAPPLPPRGGAGVEVLPDETTCKSFLVWLARTFEKDMNPRSPDPKDAAQFKQYCADNGRAAQGILNYCRQDPAKAAEGTLAVVKRMDALRYPCRTKTVKDHIREWLESPEAYAAETERLNQEVRR